MKVTLLTASSKEYWLLMALSAPNKLEYCIRHGVQFAMNIHTHIDAFKNWGERELFMLDALDAYDCDWLWFMGADTIITNQTLDIRTLCDDEFDFIIGVDVNGINNDSFLLKNCKASRDFLKRVLCRRDAPHDQDAMFAEKDVSLKTKLVGQRTFNSYKYDEYGYGPFPEGTWQEGDFVLHVPGLHLVRRVQLMQEYLGKVKR